MHEYKCPRCGYITTSKPNMEYHFDRKNTCDCKIKNVKLTTRICRYVLDRESVIVFNCRKCNKKYKHKSSLCRHLIKCTNNINEQQTTNVNTENVQLDVSVYILPVNEYRRVYELYHLNNRVIHNIQGDVIHSNIKNNCIRVSYMVINEELDKNEILNSHLALYLTDMGFNIGDVCLNIYDTYVNDKLPNNVLFILY
jgi:predicted RNA-binding Zn-ribbon protein involved in translation (DUF1610 family)